MVHHALNYEQRTCPVCGVKIKGLISPLANELHTRSLAHRRSPRLKQLLQSEATLEEIGNEMGITRERVRQIARQLGIDRMELRRDRTARRQAARAQEDIEQFIAALPNTRLGRFLEAAAKKGLSSELVEYVGYNPAGPFRPNQALVNGKLVVLRQATILTNAFGTDYIRVSSTNHNSCDVIAAELPDGRWYLCKPFGVRGSNNTLFALHDVRPGDKGYTYNRDHNHRDNIENWTLLTDAP